MNVFGDVELILPAVPHQVHVQHIVTFHQDFTQVSDNSIKNCQEENEIDTNNTCQNDNAI